MAGKQQEYIVRAPKASWKKLSVMRFGKGVNLDFSRFTSGQVARENNLREFKTANDIEQHPRFGAGSEYGKQQREEARRKKYGRKLQAYDEENQPWQLTLSSAKQSRQFKGVREGGVSENTSYFIFLQLGDGSFEAHPVSDWYSFSPIPSYRFLTSEEAEEEFMRRDKTMDLFNIMRQKRWNLNTEQDSSNVDSSDTSRKQSRSLKLTELEDWSGSDSDHSDTNEPTAKEKGVQRKKAKVAKLNNDGEAVEESDEGDADDKEDVGYITSGGSSDESLPVDSDGEKGVVDESGLRDLNESDDEEPAADEDTKKEGQGDSLKNLLKKREEEESSSSDESGGDSDPDAAKSAVLTKRRPSSPPPKPEVDIASMDRKRKTEFVAEAAIKRLKVQRQREESSSGASSSATALSAEVLDEKEIRRYLARRPVTIKQLLKKFKSKHPDMPSDELGAAMTRILKKINPDKRDVQGTFFFSLSDSATVGSTRTQGR